MSTILYIFYLPQHTQSLSFTEFSAQDANLDSCALWYSVSFGEWKILEGNQKRVECEDRIGIEGRVFMPLATFLRCHLERVKSVNQTLLLPSVKSSHHDSGFPVTATFLRVFQPRVVTASSSTYLPYSLFLDITPTHL